MVRASAITLIGEDPNAHGVFDSFTPSERTVPCEVRSVTRNEAYEAMSQGLAPEIVFVLSDYAEYQGEKNLVYDGVSYRVIRTYTGSTFNGREEEIELVCERSNHV